MPVKALVLWADDRSPNLGVRVLAAGSAALLERSWPGIEVEFQNFGQRRRELPLGRLRSLARERLTGERGTLDWLGGFDIVLDTRAGDSFADIYGMKRHATMTAVSELAARAGVPVVLGPQTIGPFDTRAGRMLARRSLGRARVVMARDSASAEYARRLGHPVDVLTTDVVFALPTPTVETSRDVVLNISGLLWNDNPHVDAPEYRRIVRDVHARLIAAGRRVTLLSHVVGSTDVDNDSPAIEAFAAAYAPDAEVIVPTPSTPSAARSRPRGS